MKDTKYILSFIGNGTDTIEEIDNFCKINLNKIAYWYVHPPFGSLYTDREELPRDETTENIEFIKQALVIFKKYNIPVQVAFNTISIRESNVSITDLLAAMKKYINIFGKPDAFIIFDKYAEAVKNEFLDIKLVRTVNEQNITDINVLNFYDILVVRGSTIYNFSLIKDIRNKFPNIEIEYLISDLDCVPTCNHYCFLCKDRFLKAVDKIGINKMLALDIIRGPELKLLADNNFIDFLKIPPVAIKDFGSLNHIERTYTGINLYTDILRVFNGLTKKFNLDEQLILDWKHNININEIIRTKINIWTKNNLDISKDQLIK